MSGQVSVFWLFPVIFLVTVFLAFAVRLIRGRGRASGGGGPEVIICTTQRGRPVVLTHLDRYLHMLVKGGTGSGKTSRVLSPMIRQDIARIAAGEELGVTLLEPKGDLVAEIASFCRDEGVPYLVLDPMDPGPTGLNPLAGEAGTAAEVVRSVLRSLFGPQEAFFAQLQETVVRNTVLLLKELRGDAVGLVDLAGVLRDRGRLADLVEEFERRRAGDDLAGYFRNEILGETAERVYQFLTGVRQQLDDLVQCAPLRRIFGARPDVNLDHLLARGGVLLVNTAMGPLGHLGDVFGRFVLLQFLHAVFRRPPGGRVPHFLYVDELPRYLLRDVERLLALGRSYRVGCVFTVQSIDQLALKEGETFKRTLVDLLATKMVFGRMSGTESVWWQEEFGRRPAVAESHTFRKGAFWPTPWLADSMHRQEVERPHFSAGFLQFLPAGRVVYRIVRENSLQLPAEGCVLPRQVFTFHPSEGKAWRPVRPDVGLPKNAGVGDIEKGGRSKDGTNRLPKGFGTAGTECPPGTGTGRIEDRSEWTLSVDDFFGPGS